MEIPLSFGGETFTAKFDCVLISSPYASSRHNSFWTTDGNRMMRIERMHMNIGQRMEYKNE